MPVPVAQLVKHLEVPEQVEAVFSKMVAKNVEDRYQTMTEVIADLVQCGTGEEQSFKRQQLFGSVSDTGLTDFLKEISMDTPKPAVVKKSAPSLSWTKNRKVLIGGGILGGLILVAALVIALRSKDGTLVVTVNEPDAEIEVLSEGGAVEKTVKTAKAAITIPVIPGKHKLRIQKQGFEPFTKDFEITADSTVAITAKVVPQAEESSGPIDSPMRDAAAPARRVAE